MAEQFAKNAKWSPEYPGQREPSWVWWSRDEWDGDLAGFHTLADRELFQSGSDGPFRRRFAHPTKDTSNAGK